MKFELVFNGTGDSIPFEVKYNRELFEFFVNTANNKNQNNFTNNNMLASKLNLIIAELHRSISKTNEVLWPLIQSTFPCQNNLEQYLDQQFLNQLHANWVKSQKVIVDIDILRHSENVDIARVGSYLHELYPDETRQIRLAEALGKLGYYQPYIDINQNIHNLENTFKYTDNLIFAAQNKYDMVDNPYLDTMVSNSDIVNFSFGYTYLGRQNIDKFENFDDDYEYDDGYNFETLEFSFNVSVEKPQTKTASPEFLAWCSKHNVKPVTTQIPIANIVNLEQNLLKYRQVLYCNSNNSASLHITERD